MICLYTKTAGPDFAALQNNTFYVLDTILYRIARGIRALNNNEQLNEAPENRTYPKKEARALALLSVTLAETSGARLHR